MSFSMVDNKIFPANHKTTFVLDHTPYFGISCEAPIEFDFIKSRIPFTTIKPISKSLWTCSVESSIEYCRIVWDLFPQGKLIKFVVSDSVANILNNWSPLQQNVNHIMNAMSLIGVPPSARSNTSEYTVIHGLRAAVSALSECTDLQWERYSSRGNEKFVNCCRVICITSARDDDSMKRLEEIFFNVLQQHNLMCATNSSETERLVPIDYCHLVIINTFPVTTESHVSNHPPKVWSPILTTEVHSIKAPLISNKLSALILQHYDLASTTVTGIPMKEEQNASSSANYDVEIYHASTAHTAILKGNTLDALAVKTVKENLEYETVTLKWCTPRSCSSSEMQNCTSMHRITPVDVNSRPSLCLINFLLNGRSVMLEMARRAGGKITSHLLAAHGGEIFIHTLCTARSVLEDPPSISEGCGGRVTDYRIPDFCHFIKQNRLYPLKQQQPSSTAKELPILKMKQRLTRYTKYWPLTIGSALIFNLKAYIEPLPTLIVKEKLTDDEVYQCKQVFYNLILPESKNEPLHLTTVVPKFKGQKREDQYKQMWNELETLIKNNLHTDKHKSIYNCLLECHKFNFDAKAAAVAAAVADNKSSVDHQRASVIRATTDSPMSPPPLAASSVPPSAPTTTQSTVAHSGYFTTRCSLFDMFVSQESSRPKTRPDFCGRTSDSLVAKLYPNLKKENERSAKGEGMVIE